MAARAERAGSAAEPGDIDRAAALLGGARVLRHRLHGAIDVHEAISRGLPRGALTHLIGNVAVLRDPAALEQAVGVSQRTVQRFKLAPDKKLSPEQSGRAWKFAEILAKATEVLGSQEEAEDWLKRPAMALDQRRPLDLLATPAGTKLVEDLLGRIQYGVYT
ncbi:MAG TPA: antitoxin Xre/MbcA/ParS toxin-binding domain-containing protein [Stellaceae bacterium]